MHCLPKSSLLNTQNTIRARFAVLNGYLFTVSSGPEIADRKADRNMDKSVDNVHIEYRD